MRYLLLLRVRVVKLKINIRVWLNLIRVIETEKHIFLKILFNFYMFGYSKYKLLKNYKNDFSNRNRENKLNK